MSDAQTQTSPQERPAPPSMDAIQAAAAMASASLGVGDPPPARQGSRLTPGVFFPRNLSSEERERLRELHPVFFAAFSRDPDMLEAALLKDPGGARRAILGDAPEQRDHNLNYTPLHVAAHLNDPVAAKRLIEAGAEPTRFIAGVSSVGLAAYSGCHHALGAMLEMGADATLVLKPEHSLGNAGSTLLHRILERGDGHERLWVVRTLILSGQYPDPLVQTEAGVSPLDGAVDSDDLSVEWLRSYIAALEGLRLSEAIRGEADPRAQGPKML